ncbi:MAG: hypothetical protein KDD69_01995 [Bdellovibrionales bacterium]|nr:hypothetical protein [Bdellovibrionales bacterium]
MDRKKQRTETIVVSVRHIEGEADALRAASRISIDWRTVAKPLTAVVPAIKAGERFEKERVAHALLALRLKA